MVDDFPDPLTPTITTSCPGLIENDTLSRALFEVPGYAKETLLKGVLSRSYLSLIEIWIYRNSTSTPVYSFFSIFVGKSIIPSVILFGISGKL